MKLFNEDKAVRIVGIINALIDCKFECCHADPEQIESFLLDIQLGLALSQLDQLAEAASILERKDSLSWSESNILRNIKEKMKKFEDEAREVQVEVDKIQQKKFAEVGYPQQDSEL